jgi:hypothetical protein
VLMNVACGINGCDSMPIAPKGRAHAILQPAFLVMDLATLRASNQILLGECQGVAIGAESCISQSRSPRRSSTSLKSYMTPTPIPAGIQLFLLNINNQLIFTGCLFLISREGRTMAKVTVTIMDAVGNKTQQVTIPDDAPANLVIGKLVQVMNMPVVGPDGNPISYKLQHKGTGRQLFDETTFVSAGVKDGDVLRLQPELTAGAHV